ncbi:MAG: type II toxin-antitoxin system RelE/ParE family toxin [Gammaproteobacteria bacterium]
MLEIFKQTLAEEDLIDIWFYSFEQWGAAQADIYLDLLNEGIYRLAENPEIGTDCGHIRQGYRRLSVRQHMVYYRISSDRIDIIRVLHESMDADRHL